MSFPPSPIHFSAVGYLYSVTTTIGGGGIKLEFEIQIPMDFIKPGVNNPVEQLNAIIGANVREIHLEMTQVLDEPDPDEDQADLK